MLAGTRPAVAARLGIGLVQAAAFVPAASLVATWAMVAVGLFALGLGLWA